MGTAISTTSGFPIDHVLHILVAEAISFSRPLPGGRGREVKILSAAAKWNHANHTSFEARINTDENLNHVQRVFISSHLTNLVFCIYHLQYFILLTYSIARDFKQ